MIQQHSITYLTYHISERLDCIEPKIALNFDWIHIYNKCKIWNEPLRDILQTNNTNLYICWLISILSIIALFQQGNLLIIRFLFQI